MPFFRYYREGPYCEKCDQEQGLSPGGPVHLLSWSCKALSCVFSNAQTASTSSVTSANSATPVVRAAQVIKELCNNGAWRAEHLPNVHLQSIFFTCVNTGQLLRKESVHVSLFHFVVQPCFV